MAKDEMVVVYDVIALKETAQALLVEVDNKEHWVPKKFISAEESEVVSEGDHGDLVVSAFIAKDRGWDYES
jgi:CO/xanthine dehydrogenase Mo-binding subunit